MTSVLTTIKAGEVSRLCLGAKVTLAELSEQVPPRWQPSRDLRDEKEPPTGSCGNGVPSRGTGLVVGRSLAHSETTGGAGVAGGGGHGPQVTAPSVRAPSSLCSDARLQSREAHSQPSPASLPAPATTASPPEAGVTETPAHAASESRPAWHADPPDAAERTPHATGLPPACPQYVCLFFFFF